MEEKKIASKEVKMQAVKSAKEEQPQKLSYEQLNQACIELSQQNQQMQKYIQQLKQQMQQMDYMLQSKRMDYLFKVVELSLKNSQASEYPCFAKDFVEECVAEIQESLTIPEQEEKQEETKEN